MPSTSVKKKTMCSRGLISRLLSLDRVEMCLKWFVHGMACSLRPVPLNGVKLDEVVSYISPKGDFRLW